MLRLALVALTALAVLAVSFALRGFDDNRLVSWRWVFGTRELSWLMLALAMTIPLAYAFARISWNSRRVVPVLFLAVVALSTRFWGEPEMIIDAARYFVQAKHLEQYGVGHFLREWGREIPAWTDLPVVPLLYGLAFQLLGESRAAGQILTSLLFGGTVVLTFHIGRTLWDHATGVSAALLLLAIPYLWTQAPLLLADVPAMFFVMLALSATLVAVERGGRARIAAAAIALATALLSKYSAWLALLALPLLWWRCGPRGAATLARMGAVIVGATGIVAAFFVWKADVLAGQIALLWTYQVPALGRWEESLVSTFLFQIHPFVTAAAVSGAALAVMRRDARALIPGMLVLVALALEIKRARYLIIVLPMLALLAAYGLHAIRDLLARRFVVTCAVTSALIVALGGYLPFLRTTSAANLPHAGAALDTLAYAEAEVIVLPSTGSAVNPAISVPMLDLFTHKRLIYREDLSPLPPPAPADVAISPVRFTWALAAPPFHAAPRTPTAGERPVAVILGTADQPLPAAVARRLAGHRLVREFAATDRAFRHQTLIRIYVPNEATGRGGDST